MSKIDENIKNAEKAVMDLAAAGGAAFQEEIESIRAKTTAAIDEAKQNARQELDKGGWSIRKFIFKHKITCWIACYFFNPWAMMEGSVTVNWFNVAFFSVAALIGGIVGYFLA